MEYNQTVGKTIRSMCKDYEVIERRNLERERERSRDVFVKTM